MGTRTKAEQEELHDLAKKIHDYGRSQHPPLSKKQLVRRFAGLGSERTFSEFVAGKFGDRPAENWILDYRAAWHLIENVGPADTEEPVIENLWPVTALKKGLHRAMQATGNGRLVLLIADTGVGKSHAIRTVVQKYRRRVLLVEADASWGYGICPMLDAVLRAFGIHNPPHGNPRKLDKVLGFLCETRRTLIIDEAHKMAPKQIDMCTTIINKSPGEVVLAAYPTLWHRLESGAAYEEARQLTGNRCAERIVINEPPDSDLRLFLRVRLGWTDKGRLDGGIKLLRRHLRTNGNLDFVRDVCARATALSEDGGAREVSTETLSRAIEAELATR